MELSVRIPVDGRDGGPEGGPEGGPDDGRGGARVEGTSPGSGVTPVAATTGDSLLAGVMAPEGGPEEVGRPMIGGV